MDDLCSRSGILSTILKWNFVNYTTVYHFYNITNSPLGYKSKIPVTNFTTISLKRFYGRSIPPYSLPRSAIGINLAYRTIVSFCSSYKVSWGFTSRVRAPSHGNFPSRRAGDGSNASIFGNKESSLSMADYIIDANGDYICSI
jgi:hypothetical protein